MNHEAQTKVRRESAPAQSRVRSLLVLGRPGSGKTALLLGTALYLRERGMDVRYLKPVGFAFGGEGVDADALLMGRVLGLPEPPSALAPSSSACTPSRPTSRSLRGRSRRCSPAWKKRDGPPGRPSSSSTGRDGRTGWRPSAATPSPWAKNSGRTSPTSFARRTATTPWTRPSFTSNAGENAGFLGRGSSFPPSGRTKSRESKRSTDQSWPAGESPSSGPYRIRRRSAPLRRASLPPSSAARCTRRGPSIALWNKCSWAR